MLCHTTRGDLRSGHCVLRTGSSFAVLGESLVEAIRKSRGPWRAQVAICIRIALSLLLRTAVPE